MGRFTHIDSLTNPCLCDLEFFHLQGGHIRVSDGCLEVRAGAACLAYARNMGHGCYRGLVGRFIHIDSLTNPCLCDLDIFFICRVGASEYPKVARRPGPARSPTAVRVLARRGHRPPI